MVLNIFKKQYTLRRFGETKLVKGRSRASYSDCMVMLNVQPLSMPELTALPEGIQRAKNIKAIGKVLIRTADENTGILADRLYYRGEWYECTGVDIWGNTPVGQTEAVFGLISSVETGDILLPPSLEAESGDDADENKTEEGDTS